MLHDAEDVLRHPVERQRVDLERALQVVLGPIADQVAEELRAAASTTRNGSTTEEAVAIAATLRPAGIRGVEVCGSRLVIDVEDPSRLIPEELDRLPVRGWAMVRNGVQIIIGPHAGTVKSELVAT